MCSQEATLPGHTHLGLVHEKWLNWLASVSKKKNICDLAQNPHINKVTYVN